MTVVVDNRDIRDVEVFLKFDYELSIGFLKDITMKVEYDDVITETIILTVALTPKIVQHIHLLLAIGVLYDRDAERLICFGGQPRPKKVKLILKKNSTGIISGQDYISMSGVPVKDLELIDFLELEFQAEYEPTDKLEASFIYMTENK